MATITFWGFGFLALFVLVAAALYVVAMMFIAFVTAYCIVADAIKGYFSRRRIARAMRQFEIVDG